jgi:hypothetical protein
VNRDPPPALERSSNSRRWCRFNKGESTERTSAGLDELMLAMDVVDTLRHERRLVERELTAGDRDRALIERLRELYAGQGIEVPDDVLAQGVGALREDRFRYTPPAPGFARSLQVAYVKRARWAKYLWALILAGVAAAAAVLLF